MRRSAISRDSVRRSGDFDSGGAVASTLVRENYRYFHFTPPGGDLENDVSGEANFRILRTNETAISIAGEPGHPGIWRLQSASATNRCVAIGQNAMNEVAFTAVDHYFHSRWRIVNRSDGTNTFTIKTGWCNDTTTTLGVGVYAYVHPTTAHLIYRCQDAIGPAEVDTGVVYTDTSWLDTYCSVNSVGVATFFTQGIGFNAIAAATIVTDIPGTPVGVMALGSFRTAGVTARPADIDFCEAFIVH